MKYSTTRSELFGSDDLFRKGQSEHETIIECEELPNHFAFENRHREHHDDYKGEGNFCRITTRIWKNVEDGVEEATSFMICRYKKYGDEVVVEITAPSCNGTAKEIETHIELLEFAVAIARSYE